MRAVLGIGAVVLMVVFGKVDGKEPVADREVEGIQFSSGKGTITRNAKTGKIDINQTSNMAVLNVNEIDDQDLAGLNISTPENGLTLLRVKSGNPSAIYGKLASSGSLVLINPNGIFVGPSGVVDVSGALATSSLDIDRAGSVPNSFDEGVSFIPEKEAEVDLLKAGGGGWFQFKNLAPFKGSKRRLRKDYPFTLVKEAGQAIQILETDNGSILTLKRSRQKEQSEIIILDPVSGKKKVW